MRRQRIGSEQKIPLFAELIGSMFIGGKSGLEKGVTWEGLQLAGFVRTKK